jgi:integrase/recombinase XerD
VIIECKKKRQSGVYRPVPVPPAFLDMLNMVHNIRAAQKCRDRGKTVRLWDWSRPKGMVRCRGGHEGREDRRSTRHAQG